MAFEGVDILVALRPDIFGDELRRQALMLEQILVHPHHQDLLVIGAVEDADMPAPRQHDGSPPEEIVVELELAWRLEGMHVAALWIDAGHHMLDDAVLACGIEPLEDDQEGPAVLGIEP